jgi:hypothetical protein
MQYNCSKKTQQSERKQRNYSVLSKGNSLEREVEQFKKSKRNP